MKFDRKFLENNRIRYVDLFDDFSENLENEPEKIWVHPNDPHPNSFGHKIMYHRLIKEYKNLR